MSIENLRRGEIGKSPEAIAASRANLLKGRPPGTSGRRLKAARERYDRELADAYPELDERRRRLLAGNLARCEVAEAFTERHGIFDAKAVRPVAALLARWGAAADRTLREAKSGEPEPDPYDDLKDYLRSKAEGR